MTTIVLAQENFLIPNGTFLAELVLFGLLFGVVWRFVVPPIQRAMRERQELIRAQFDEAREAQERAEAAEADYQRTLDEARAQAAQIREEARAKGRQVVEEARAKAQAEADRELVHGRQHLTAERDSLVRDLRGGVGDLAVDLASRVVGDSLADEARDAGWVEEFLSQADASTAAPPVSASAGEGA